MTSDDTLPNNFFNSGVSDAVLATLKILSDCAGPVPVPVVPILFFRCPFLSISIPAKSGLIFSQLSPWLIERNTSCAPTYNVLELWGEINNGVFQLKRKSSFLSSTIVFLDPVFWSIRVICPNWELEYLVLD